MNEFINATEQLPSLNVPFVMAYNGTKYLAVRRASDGSYVARDTREFVFYDGNFCEIYQFEREFNDFKWRYL